MPAVTAWPKSTIQPMSGSTARSPLAGVGGVTVGSGPTWSGSVMGAPRAALIGEPSRR